MATLTGNETATSPPSPNPGLSNLAIPLEHIILISGVLVFATSILALIIFLCLLQRKRRGQYRLGGTQHLINENAYDNYGHRFDEETFQAANDELDLPPVEGRRTENSVVIGELPPDYLHVAWRGQRLITLPPWYTQGRH